MNTRYLGMSYEQLSRHSLDLIKQAAETGDWHSIMDDLAEIKRLMQALAPKSPVAIERPKMIIDRICNREDLFQWWNELPNPKHGMPPRAALVEAVLPAEAELALDRPTGSATEGWPEGGSLGTGNVSRTVELDPKTHTVVSRPLMFYWRERTELAACRMLAAVISCYLSQFDESETIIVRVAPQVERDSDLETCEEWFRCRVRMVVNPERNRLLRDIDEDRVFVRGVNHL